MQKKFRFSFLFVLLTIFVVTGCSLLNGVPDRNYYHPKPDKFGIYQINTANDGRVAYGQIMADNLSTHNLSGFVNCKWSEPSGGTVFNETKDFDLMPGTRKMLEFSAMVPIGGQGRMHLECNVIYLVCHDCGEKVVIDR